MNPSSAGSGSRSRWLRRSALIAACFPLWDCRPYPDGPPCCPDRPPWYGEDPYPYGPSSGTPGDLPGGAREFGLALDPGLRMWFDAYDAVPRLVFIGNGPDDPSSLAHDLREARPWLLAYAGRTEPLYPRVGAWDHSGPTAHVRIRLDRPYAGDPVTVDLEIRHGYEGNAHVLIEAYHANGLRDGESLGVRVGGAVSRGAWRQQWTAGGNGYLRGPAGQEDLWMPGNGYHEARVRFR